LAFAGTLLKPKKECGAVFGSIRLTRLPPGAQASRAARNINWFEDAGLKRSDQLVASRRTFE
jgi:hypothetical protein